MSICSGGLSLTAVLFGVLVFPRALQNSFNFFFLFSLPKENLLARKKQFQKAR
jgi:hypothetical protein